MTTTDRLSLSMLALVAAIAVAPPVRAEPATTVAAVDAKPGALACGAGRITPLQERLLGKADQGIAPLMQFIHRTRMIYQLDVMEVANKLEGWRASGNCATAAVVGDDVGS